jgi:hypothetical protein
VFSFLVAFITRVNHVGWLTFILWPSLNTKSPRVVTQKKRDKLNAYFLFYKLEETFSLRNIEIKFTRESP